MAEIRPYTSQILAGGQIGGRSATAGDFGPDTRGLAAGVSATLDTLQQRYEAEDVTQVHVNMAKARAEWTQTLQDRTNEAVPGDRTFAPTLMQDMQKYFDEGAASAKTIRGKQVWATLSANMRTEFTDRAIGVQADLAAKGAVNEYTEMLKAKGQTVYKDYTQVDAVKKAALAAIDDPGSLFAQLPAPAREKFKQQMLNDIDFAAARGFVRKNPGALSGTLTPEELKQFKPYEGILQTNVTPGGQVSIRKGAMTYAPEVTAAAAARNVNPNIMLAQIDQESNGKVDAVSPKGAAGVSQFIPGTAARYGVDVKDPKSSIQGQAAYMADLLKMFNGDYVKALAGYNWGEGNVQKAMQRYGDGWLKYAPAETQGYVNSVLQKAGMVVSDKPAPVEQGAAQPAQRVDVSNKSQFFKGLSWEQIDQVVNEDIRLSHQKMAMADRARQEAERAKQEAQAVALDGYMKRILDPQNNGGLPTDAEISKDTTLTAQQKQHVSDYVMRKTREVEDKANPGAVRNLMLQIHAADTDPTKSYNMAPVDEAYRLGQISTSEYKFLRQEVEQMRDGTSNPFGKQVQMARDVAFNSLARSIIGQMQPEIANEAAYRFNMDMQAQIEKYRKENKDPRTLLDPSSRDYLLKPERIMSFMPSGGQAMSQEAGKAVEAAKNDRTPAPGFEVGKSYTVNGKQLKYIGGPINLSTSWQS